MRIQLEINEAELRKIILIHLQQHMSADITADDVKIEVKSTQNYKSEWEQAAFRATIDKRVR